MKISYVLVLLLLAVLVPDAQGRYSRIISQNKAKVFGHKWVLMRCLDMEAYWMENHPIVLKTSSGVRKTVNYGTTAGRRHLLGGKRGPAMRVPERVDLGVTGGVDLDASIAIDPHVPTAAPRIRDPEQEALRAMYDEAEKGGQEGVLAAKWVEETCVKSSADKGPRVLEHEMKPEVYLYMDTYHQMLMKGVEVTAHGEAHDDEAHELPHAEPSDLATYGIPHDEPRDHHALRGPHCPPTDGGVNMVVVGMSILVGVGIGVGATLHVTGKGR